MGLDGGTIGGIILLSLIGLIVVGFGFGFVVADHADRVGGRSKVNKKGTLGIVSLVIMLFGILGLSKYIKNYM